jgi:small subunit ribosomal protein S20
VANHPQAAKRNRQRIKRTARNRVYRSTARTFVKRTRALIAEGKADEARDVLKKAARHLDRCVTKGVLHRRTASRTISRLHQALGKLAAGS